MLKWCATSNYTPAYPPPLDYHSFYVYVFFFSRVFTAISEEVKQRELRDLRKANLKVLAGKVKFCKYCGCTHLPLDKFGKFISRGTFMNLTLQRRDKKSALIYIISRKPLVHLCQAEI